MQIQWDERKRAANIEKHGVDFVLVLRMDWAAALVRADVRRHYGEVRLNALAPVGARLYALTFTVERRAVRVISLRKASNREIEAYERQIED